MVWRRRALDAYAIFCIESANHLNARAHVLRMYMPIVECNKVNDVHLDYPAMGGQTVTIAHGRKRWRQRYATFAVWRCREWSRSWLWKCPAQVYDE